jgi:hypothetical protein
MFKGTSTHYVSLSECCENPIRLCQVCISEVMKAIDSYSTTNKRRFSELSCYSCLKKSTTLIDDAGVMPPASLRLLLKFAEKTLNATKAFGQSSEIRKTQLRALYCLLRTNDQTCGGMVRYERWLNSKDKSQNNGTRGRPAQK